MFPPGSAKCCHSLALGDKLTAMYYYLRHIAVLVGLIGWAAGAAAQSFEPVGTRAAGMGGAFVAVADDASAAYWNPAGFASGNFFSLLVDHTRSKSDPAVPDGVRRTRSYLFAMGLPALAVSYYQVRLDTLTPRTAGISARGLKGGGERADEPDEVHVETLTTHHTGATVVQSVGPGIAVGATLKLVRGIASARDVPDGPREALLGQAQLRGKGSTRFDTDVGVMKSGSFFKAGLTIRNVTNPEFETPDGARTRLRRQARAGLAIVPVAGWVVDADLDLTSTPDVLGPVRDFAFGTEGRLGRKAYVRGGFRTNTRHASERAVAAGASYMVVTALLVDAQITGGDARANRGWGIAARFVY